MRAESCPPLSEVWYVVGSLLGLLALLGGLTLAVAVVIARALDSPTQPAVDAPARHAPP